MCCTGRKQVSGILPESFYGESLRMNISYGFIVASALKTSESFGNAAYDLTFPLCHLLALSLSWFRRVGWYT
jgi:hypothetical protein